MNGFSSLHGLRGQRGYILALNILVLALMLIGATYIGQRMSLAKTMALTEKQHLEDEIALQSARAKVLFVLAAVPRSKAGLGKETTNVALDGRYYRVGENALASLQDTSGLINVNTIGLDGTGRDRLERLLGTYGVEGIDANRLTDILLDYRDADDLRRINGAEREDYRAAGQEDFIRNDNLRVPTELGRLLRWGDYSALWQDDPVTDHISTQKREPFNPNTASWRALVAMSGMPRKAAQDLVEQREKGSTAADMDIAGLAFPGDVDALFVAAVSRFPSPSVLVTLRTDGSSWGEQWLVTQTPGSATSPWHIEYARRVPLKPLSVPADKIPKLPEAAVLRDFSAKDQVQSPF